MRSDKLKKVDIYFIRSSACDKLMGEAGLVATVIASRIVLDEFISLAEGPHKRSGIPGYNYLRVYRTNP
jgi:hypothetical protein